MTTTAHLYRAVQDGQGNALSGAQVTICSPGTQTAIPEQLFSDEALTTPLSNPFVTNNGIVDVYLSQPKTVAIKTVYGTQTVVVDYVDALPSAENVLVTSSPVVITNAPAAGYIPQMTDSVNMSFVDPATIFAANIPSVTAKFITPEQYGAVGNGIADDTAAFQAAIDAVTAAGGGVIVCTARRYVVGGIVLKTGVLLNGVGGGKDSGGRRTTLVPPAGFAGWVIDTPATQIVSAGLKGIGIAATPPSSGASPLVGGIRVQNGAWCLFEDWTVGGTSLGAFNLVNGVACTVRGFLAQNYYQYRTLASNEAVVYIGGTDHTIANGQCNGADNATVYDSTNFYRAAFHLNTYTSWVFDVNGEFADVGVRVSGVNNKLIGIRADFNAGRGIEVSGWANILSAVTLIENSTASPGSYDGLYFTTSGVNNVLQGLTCMSLSSSQLMRYVVNDQSQPGSTNPDHLYANLNQISGVTADEAIYGTDLINRLVPRLSLYPPGAGENYNRPPSRRSHGMTWYDTGTSTTAVSNGTWWFDVLNPTVIVGNMLSPDRASMLTTANGWGPFVSEVTAPSWVDGHAAFATPHAAQVAVAAAGVTNAQAAVLLNGSIAVQAGTSYQMVCFARALAGTAANVQMTVTWYNASSAVISSTTSTPVTATGTTTGAYYNSGTVTAPANAAFAVPAIIFTRPGGLTLNEQFEYTKVAFAKGTLTNYVHP